MSATPLFVLCYVGIASISGRRRARIRANPPWAALVEARPRPPLIAGGGSVDNGNIAVALVPVRDFSSPALSGRDRADDMQAEVMAMTRASVYSPELLSSKYGSRPIKVVGRALKIFMRLGTFAFNLWLDQVNGRLDKNQRKRAVQLRETFTKLGPTFVKIGQDGFTYQELVDVTQNFDTKALIGEGGFEKLYKGHLDKKDMDVAVKQLDRNGFQGNREFLVDMMLSLLTKCSYKRWSEDRKSPRLVSFIKQLEKDLVLH